MLRRESYIRNINRSFELESPRFLERLVSTCHAALMNRDKMPAKTLVSKRTSARYVTRFVVFVLLFSVAGLSTRAKTSLYYPNQNSAHYLSIASKMLKSSQSVATLEQPAIQPVSAPLPPRLPEARPVAEDLTSPKPALLRLFISLQLRSPPSR